MQDGSTIIVRYAVYLVLAALFGLSAFSLYGLQKHERGSALVLRPWLSGFALAGLVVSAFAMLLMVSVMAGTPIWPVDSTAVAALVVGGPIGSAWVVRMIALAVAGAAAIFAGERTGSLLVAMTASAVAMGTLAWTGHGAMDEGSLGWFHLAADIVHLLAAGVWIGALFGLLLLLARPASRVDTAHLELTHRALHGFGAIGTVVVATIVVTGLVNSWLLVGPSNVPSMMADLYGRLLVIKVALFVGMLALAALNRFRLTPAFERSIATADHNGALGALRRSLGIEAGLVVVIMGLVAWLGTLAPPASGM
ncbi:copper homeostasis membrane protein CopD [Tardiphaga sp.]|uniref:copper homeostasis membrane protein CopD n=1 Tax=Tardiphaga sp. TaxID=1926292 RepID=UPI00352AEB3B